MSRLTAIVAALMAILLSEFIFGMMGPFLFPDSGPYTFIENAYELLTSTDAPKEAITMVFLVYPFCRMICFFLLVKTFRSTIHLWKSHQAKRKISTILEISKVMKSNPERMMAFLDDIRFIVQRYSNGVADYDGFALFMCLHKRGHLPQDLTYDDFMFENVVSFLQGKSKLREDIYEAFQSIGQKGLTIFHDLGLDPNSDDIYAILIAFAIQKACKGTAQINFVAVAGSDETRKSRARYLNEIITSYFSFTNIRNNDFGNYYLSVQDFIKPLPFIKDIAITKAHFFSNTRIQSMPSEQISGIVFFCGHLEKGESSLILDNLSPNATVIAQTTDNGNFNIPKGDSLLGRCDEIHGTSFTIPWQTVNGIILDIVKRVNQMAMVLMLTSEIPAMTKLSQSGSEQPRAGEGHYEVTSAFTRSLVIDDSFAFYNELSNLL